jgi:fructuronate reductase
VGGLARLRLAALDRVPPDARPGYDPGAVGVGIVHLGLGAFVRAHVAVYTDDVLATHGGDWGLCGVSQRSRTVPDQLAPQDGLYSVLERGPRGTRARVIGCVREVLLATASPDTLAARIADVRTRIVSLTVTEKGYRHDPATGRLRREDPEFAADAEGRPPRTVVGQLAAGLDARRAAGAGPVTVLCCDNLPRNGRMLRGLVAEFTAWRDARTGGELAGWVDRNVAFPSTLVDRIVPATQAADRDEAARLLGVTDAGTVVAEPFRQWVIEDTFAAGRPAWEDAGAILTDDVTSYEVLKLRLLNGAHSTLAYLGALAGHEFIWQAVADPDLAAVTRRLMTDDASPTVPAPVDVDVGRYRDEVLARFANPALGHRTTQVAMDGSHKLPQRLLDTARERLAAGAEPVWVCLAVAAWMRYVATHGADLDDPMAARLAAALGGADDPPAVVRALLGVRDVFGADLAESTVFGDRVTDWLAQLHARGAAETVRAAAEASTP